MSVEVKLWRIRSTEPISSSIRFGLSLLADHNVRFTTNFLIVAHAPRSLDVLNYEQWLFCFRLKWKQSSSIDLASFVIPYWRCKCDSRTLIIDLDSHARLPARFWVAESCTVVVGSVKNKNCQTRGFIRLTKRLFFSNLKFALFPWSMYIFWQRRDGALHRGLLTPV